MSGKGRGGGDPTDPWTHLQNRMALFVQDDFKMTSSLTLNAGLRWAYTSPLVEKDNRQSNFDIVTGERWTSLGSNRWTHADQGARQCAVQRQRRRAQLSGCADFDNVVVSGGTPSDTLCVTTKSGTRVRTVGHRAAPENGGINQGYDRLLQNSTLTDGRLVTGVAFSRDQVIEAHVQADHYGAGADRWFGVLGRYVNDGTYYY